MHEADPFQGPLCEALFPADEAVAADVVQEFRGRPQVVSLATFEAEIYNPDIKQAMDELRAIFGVPDQWASEFNEGATVTYQLVKAQAARTETPLPTIGPAILDCYGRKLPLSRTVPDHLKALDRFRDGLVEAYLSDVSPLQDAWFQWAHEEYLHRRDEQLDQNGFSAYLWGAFVLRDYLQTAYTDIDIATQIEGFNSGL